MSDAAERLRWSTVEDEGTLPGLVERVRHPEFRDVEFLHVRAKSLLNHVPEAAGLPFEWTINVYRGCTHACTYCFARPTHTYLDLNAGEDFDRVIVVKVNAVRRLRAELRRPSWTGEMVALGTNTDPYQRAEGRYRLTRGIIETMTTVGNPFTVLTKSPLALRDSDLFEAAQARTGTAVNFSIATLDEDVWRITEPGTPHPRRRVEAVAELTAAGVPSGVMVAPIIPGLSDGEDQLGAVVAAAVEAGATFITPVVLHLRPGVREVFMERMADDRPDLLPHFRRLYDDGSYAPAAERRRIRALVRRLVRDAGGLASPRSRRTPSRRSRVTSGGQGRPHPVHEQPRLPL